MKRKIPYTDMIGKTITTLRKVGDTLHLYLKPKGAIILEPWGDCCSETWIESIDLVEPLIGGTIRSVEDIDMPHYGNIGTLLHPIVEEVNYYGLRITTDKGVSVIDYRNDSNGYYGGQLEAYYDEEESRP